MAEKETAKKATVELNSDAEALLHKAKGFWAKFSKPIIYAGSAIILLVAGYFAYKYLYKLPRYDKALNSIFMADRVMMGMGEKGTYPADSVKILLDGGTVDNQKVTGLLKITKEFSGTPAGNRANYMAGLIYLQTKDFDKAIKYLKEFDGSVNYQFQMAAYEMLGQAYSEKNNKDEALSYFKKAAGVNAKDESNTPRLLLLAANYADEIGKSADAIELLKKLKENYGTSRENTEADKLLAKLGLLQQ